MHERTGAPVTMAFGVQVFAVFAGERGDISYIEKYLEDVAAAIIREEGGDERSIL